MDFNLQHAGDLTKFQLYQDNNAFRVMLDAIGIQLEQRNRLVNDGFNSMKDIIDLHSNDVEGFKKYLTNLNKTFASSTNEQLRVYFSPVDISRLVGVVYYFNHAINTFHRLPDLLLIDEEISTVSSLHYRESNTEKDDDDCPIDIPKLSGSSNWIIFRDKFKMKLHKTTGARGFHLGYIVDDTTRPVTSPEQPLVEVDTIDINDDEAYTISSTHFGRGFKSDNKAVWDLLKINLIGLPSYNHISRYDTKSDGRQAWTSLRQFYEGEDFIERTRESAFARLTSTFYKGETSKFDFEKYINVHKTAHRMLQDCDFNNGSGLDDATKIQHFKSGIRPEAGLEFALTTSRSNPTYRGFDHLVSFLSAEVDQKKIRGQPVATSTNRRVSSAQTSRSSKPTSNHDKSIESCVVDGKRVYRKSYPKKEFRSLTKTQREAVIKMHKDHRAHSQERGVSAVRDSHDSPADTPDIQPSSSKRKAEAGSVGNFIHNRRSKK